MDKYNDKDKPHNLYLIENTTNGKKLCFVSTITEPEEILTYLYRNRIRKNSPLRNEISKETKDNFIVRFISTHVTKKECFNAKTEYIDKNGLRQGHYHKIKDVKEKFKDKSDLEHGTKKTRQEAIVKSVIKPVIMVNKWTGDEIKFSSITEAANNTSYSNQRIYANLKGKSKLIDKTYFFKYAKKGKK